MSKRERVEGVRASRRRLPLAAALTGVAVLVLTAACNGDPIDEAADPDDDAEAEDDGEPADEDAEYVLEFTSALPEGGLNYGFDWFADEVAERTDGQVGFERFYSASLMGVEETLPAMGDGRVDMGWLGVAFFPAELPLWSIAGAAFQTDHPIGQAGAFHRMWDENEQFRQEWEDQGVRPLIFQPWSPGIMGTPEPVESLDDLSGQRLRVVGFVAPAFEELGVEPVAIPTEEIYESIQRGVVEGYAPWSFDRSMVDVGLHEVAPHKLDPGVGHYANTAIVISQESWDELPADLQETMEEIVEEFVFEESADLYAQQQEEACDAVLDADGSARVISEEELEEFQERAGDASLDQWRDNAEEQGLSEDEIAQFREDFLAAHDEIAAETEWESGMEACAARSD